ncbi:MAG: amidohydrolase family protein [Intrasporangiaceae bacterium]|nr:amidohydrolase family protein [Intrasporangiaceae bacterium]
MSIIDARVRLPQDCRPVPYSAPARQTEQYDAVLGLTEKMNAGTLERLLDSLRAQDITAAVMHAESEGGEDGEVLNDSLAEVVAQHSGMFKGIGCVDIADSRPTDMARQTARMTERGFLGLTLQPAFFGVDIDDRVLYPMYSRAEELGLIVCLHTGINYSRLHPMRHERAEMLDQVACDFPDLRLLACHAGWPWATEYAAVARRHPTVYLEFGALAPKYVARAGTGWDAMFAMMGNVLRDQVLYGSDWPMMEPERALREWRESGLDPAALQALFTDNAARLFGFDTALP